MICTRDRRAAGLDQELVRDLFPRSLIRAVIREFFGTAARSHRCGPRSI